jgi:peptide deformylase
MALRTIRKDEDPVLRKVSKAVTVFDDKLKHLVNDMIDTMYEADGVGLAAPQIGILKRIFVIDTYDDTGVKVFINPEFTHEEGEQYEIEGCLSVPGVHGRVKRPATVKVTALNEKGETVHYKGADLFARALCHENDHLDGILFTDKCVLVDEDDDEEDEDL